MDVRLYDKETGSLIGLISKTDFQFLQDQFEEESTTDTDYFVDSNTIDALEEAGAAKSLLTLLRAAVGKSEGIDIRWEPV